MDEEERYDTKQREASFGGLLAGIFILLLVAILVMAVFILVPAIQPSSPLFNAPLSELVGSLNLVT